MATFEELKKKAAETAEMIADKSIEFAKIAADKTKSVAKIAKLKGEILSEKENLKKSYIQLGKLYYEAYKDEPEEMMAQLCADISVSLGIIDAKEMEIEAVRAGDEEGAEEGCDFNCASCNQECGGADDDFEVEIVEESPCCECESQGEGCCDCESKED